MSLDRKVRRGRRVLTLMAALVVTAAMAGTAGAAPAVPGGAPVRSPWASLPGKGTGRNACDAPPPGHAACLAIVTSVPVRGPDRRDAGGATEEPHAYFAADLQDAYKLPSSLLGSRQTIAIVAAFDNPNAEDDLAVYREANGLPKCDEDFPCFRKVDQRGGTEYPQPEQGWGLEIALDLQMASAACPNCRLLLVEADDSSFANLTAAVDTAVRLGADVVSNSYGSLGEFSTQMAFAKHYDHPGTVMVAASGDSGLGAGVPAVFGGVIAVGGTTLTREGDRWTETAWNSAGSACSAYVPKPSWQRDRLCDKRAVADVAAVADPAAPVAVYDTFGPPGWVAMGGTSAAAPLIAGVYALAGNADTVDPGARLYAEAAKKARDGRPNLLDITGGFEGFPEPNGFCGGGYLCTPGRGYDGPSGLGAPNGIGAF
uniref:S53 family peptidase n=1 Tax=Actinomadura sp. CA-154981 TaxID=3240037 RepID=UPI003F499BA8